MIKREESGRRIIFWAIACCAWLSFSEVTTGFCDVVDTVPDYEDLEYIAGEIANNLPNNWKLIESKRGEVPWGHYWGMKYDGHKGILLVFQGDCRVFVRWIDENGNRRQDPLGTESLDIWIMPPEYSEGWKRFFVMNRPEPAELVWSGRMANVFGRPGHILSLEEDKKFKEDILPKALSTSWPDSPWNTGNLTWGAWRDDIKGALKLMEEHSR